MADTIPLPIGGYSVCGSGHSGICAVPHGAGTVDIRFDSHALQSPDPSIANRVGIIRHRRYHTQSHRLLMLWLKLIHCVLCFKAINYRSIELIVTDSMLLPRVFSLLFKTIFSLDFRQLSLSSDWCVLILIGSGCKNSVRGAVGCNSWIYVAYTMPTPSPRAGFKRKKDS